MAFRTSTYFRGDAMDDYLTSLALVRKQVAMDETSLFRAASEQIYFTQKFHVQLEERCVAYMNRHPEKFDHLNHVQARIQALAFLYKRDFLIYREIAKPPVNVTNYGYPKKVILCESFGNHFDCLYPRAFQQKAAICQSLTYEMLYKGLFRMDTEVAAAVGFIRKQSQRHRQCYPCPYPLPPHSTPLQSSPSLNFSEADTTAFQNDPRSMNGYVRAAGREMNQTSIVYCRTNVAISNLPSPASYYLGAPMTMGPGRFAPNAPLSRREEAIREKEIEMAITGPPFPYKVAKALDPVVYRNIEYDVWLDERKALFGSANALQNCAFPPGMNCFVSLDSSDEYAYFGIVQELDPNGEWAIVYLPELREKKQVQMDRLQGSPRNFKYPQDLWDVYHQRRRPRNRHQTWTSAYSQQQTEQTNTSSSWPLSATNSAWQSPPTPNHVLPSPPVNCYNEMQKAGSCAPEVTFPPNEPFTVSSAQNGPALPPATLGPMNGLQTSFPFPPPLSMAVTAPLQPYPFMPNRQPNEEDLATLRQFYELGGCEYFRQFLASNQHVQRIVQVERTLNQTPVMVLPRQPGAPLPICHMPTPVQEGQGCPQRRASPQ